MNILEVRTIHTGPWSGPAGGAPGARTPTGSQEPHSSAPSVPLRHHVALPALCPPPGAQPAPSRPAQSLPLQPVPLSGWRKLHLSRLGPPLVTPMGPCSTSGPQIHLLPPVWPAWGTLFLTPSPEERTAGGPIMPAEKPHAVPGLKAHSRCSKKAHNADFPEISRNLHVGRERRVGIHLSGTC